MGMIAPLLCAAGLYWFARRFHLSRSNAFLASSLAWGVCTLVITEVLSAIHALFWWPLLISWIVVFVAVVGVGIFAPSSDRNIRSAPREDRSAPRYVGQLLAVLALIALLGIVGVISPPANSDSMAYHLPRVMHWMQHHSVRHYATGNVTQLYHSPWAEFAMLHFQILTDGDRFASSIQWMALLICLVGVHTLTVQMTGQGQRVRGHRAPWLAVVFALTIPNTLLQAVSTQNNLVVSAWLITAAVMLFAFRNCVGSDSTRIGKAIPAIGFGAAAGLAVLTKGTAYLYILPLVIGFVAISFRYLKFRGILFIAIAGLFAASLNAGHWTRNWLWCKSPLMPADQAQIFHTHNVGPSLISANVINNLAIELRTGVPIFDQPIWRGATKLQSMLGSSGTDPRIALANHALTTLPARGINEDIAGNPVHLLMLGCIFFVVLARGIFPGERDDAFFLSLAVLIGFGLFCALIRWQMFHARLHLPLMMLATPIVAVTWSRYCRPDHIQKAMWALLILAACTIAANGGHPLFGSRSIFTTPREKQYFTLRPMLEQPYQRVADALARQKIRTIGISSGPVWEYPLWIMLKNREGAWPDIRSFAPQVPTPDGPPMRIDQFPAIIVMPNRHGSEESTAPKLGWPAQQAGHGVQLIIKPQLHKEPPAT